MNLGPGGKQPLMLSIVLPNRTEQSMILKATDRNWDVPEVLIGEDLIGKPGGMKRVLQERGLWIEGLKKQFGRQKKDKKRHFGERLVEEAMSEARISDRWGAGKGCWVRRILEAEQGFATEESPLETVILEAVHELSFIRSSTASSIMLSTAGSSWEVWPRTLQVLVFITGGGYP